MSRILVCGSRKYVDRESVATVLRDCIGEGDHEILHGCCQGADRIAEEEAEKLGYRIRAFPALWNVYGKAAGPIRNQKMIDEGPDLVIAFGDGKGTNDTCRRAKAAGIHVVRVP